MKSIIYHALALTTLLSLSACYEDKGNYDYTEVDDVTITLPSGISALKGADDIEFTPTVVSKIDGEIKADNPNYEFGCKINYSHRNDEGETESWYDINPDHTLAVKYPANFPAQKYTMWYSVTNKATGVTYNAQGSVEVLSTTYEGWLVLSNNGTNKEARLDIIFKDPKGKSRCSYDLLGDNAPEITEATQIGFYPSMYASGDQLYIFSKSGGYKLDAAALTTKSSQSVKNLEFIMPNKVLGEPAYFGCVIGGGYSPLGRVIITSEGNVYKINTSSYGACYEYPINNTEWGSEPAYKVAPFIGTSESRNSSQALLYDETNRRFLRWNAYGQYYEEALATDKTLYAQPDPENKLFSYQTGMELVHMEGTRYANGVVFSVLQDNSGSRHIYGIDIAGEEGMTQVSVDENISAEHFNDAECYAFHSQMPFALYSYGNKVYCYNTSTKSVTDIVQIDASEHITKIKFNLYKNMNLATLNDQSEEFMNKQYRLIVASGNGQADGGKVRFYDISLDGKFTLAEEYSGFGEEIVDVLYRERR